MNIYNIDQFKTWNMSIDLNRPEMVINDLVKLAKEVEQECPVGKFFGVSGIGEGIIWSTNLKQNDVIRFKVEGKKYNSFKVKTIIIADAEKTKRIREITNYLVIESRLLQGINQMFTRYNRFPTSEDTNFFIERITSAIFIENTQVIIGSNLEAEVMDKVSKKVTRWFKKYLMSI